MNKKTIIVSFSGGRTSAFMSKWLLDNKSNDFNLKFVFANTGLEHEETLIFVDKCDREWGLNLAWIEAITHKQLGKGQTYKIVNFDDAARNGEPYKLLSSIEGVPCVTRPICTDRLKSGILTKFRNSFGKNTCSAIGIRVDEIDRMNGNAKKLRLIYPLISMRPTMKPEIINWFKRNAFDLKIPEHLGNCITCWKKTDRKLMTIAKNTPEAFNSFIEIEEKYNDILSKKDGAVNGVDRKIFRNHRSCSDMIKLGKSSFIEWTDIEYIEQLDLFGLDLSQGCEESCEI